MTVSKWLIYFLVWPIPETAIGILYGGEDGGGVATVTREMIISTSKLGLRTPKDHSESVGRGLRTFSPQTFYLYVMGLLK